MLTAILIDRCHFLPEFTGGARQPSVRDALVRSMERVEMISTSASGGQPHQTPGSEIASQLSRASKGRHTFELAGCEIELLLDDSGCKVSITTDDPNRVFGSVSVSVLIDMIRHVHSEMKSVAFLGPLMGVRAIGRPNAFARPPRLHPSWTTGNLVDCYSEDFHLRHKQGNVEAFRKIETAPLPHTATRWREGDLLFIRWVDTLDSPDAIDAARRTQQQWLGELLGLPIRPGFNEQGDYRIPASLAPASAPFTFQEPRSAYLFKAVVRRPDGGIDMDDESAVRDVLKTRRLPGEGEVKKVYAFLPTRASAIELRPALLQLGFDGVLYVGKDNQLWDPDPPEYAAAKKE